MSVLWQAVSLEAVSSVTPASRVRHGAPVPVPLLSTENHTERKP